LSGATKAEGPEKLTQRLAAYPAVLPKTATYAIEGDKLWLRDSTGVALAHCVAK